MVQASSVQKSVGNGKKRLSWTSNALIALAASVSTVGLSINLNLYVSADSTVTLPTFNEVLVSLNGFQLVWFLVLPALFVFYRWVITTYAGDKRIRKHSIILGFFLSLFLIVGYSFTMTNSFNLICGNAAQWVKSTLAFLAYWLLSASCLAFLFGWLKHTELLTINPHPCKFFTFLFDKAPLWIPFAAICLMWLPRLILYYPGLMMGDTQWELTWIADWLYSGDITQLHSNDPLIHTLFIALCIKVGLVLFSSENVGFYLYIVVQFLLSAFALAFCLKRLGDRKAPYWLRFACLVFFCITPFFINYAVLGTKDVMFSSFALLYLVFFSDLVDGFGGGLNNRRNLIAVIVFGILLSLFRFNGLAIILLSLPILALGHKDKALPILGSAVAIIGVTVCIQYVLIPAQGIKDIPTGEYAPVSQIIPLQQTARYVSEFGDEVTKEEKKAISGVMNYDQIASKYDPDIADRVSEIYKKKVSAEAMDAYWVTWRAMFWKHPLCYVASTVNGYYGYFYFGSRFPGLYNFDASAHSSEYVRPKVNALTKGYFDFDSNHSDAFIALRSVINGYDAIFENAPVLSLLMSSALYMWVFLIGIVFCAVRGDRKAVLMYLPILAIFLAALMSPRNGTVYFRYIYPVACCLPYVLIWSLNRRKASHEKGAVDET